MLLTPIKITLYDSKTQETIKEYSQSIITFDMLLRASQLSTVLDSPKKKERKWWMWWEKEISKEADQINALMELVVEFFSNQFSVEELRKGADITEVMSVMKAIMGRANALSLGNPTPPRQPRQK
jgi:hypothetical protein